MDSQGFRADSGLEIFFLRRLPFRISERLFGGSEAVFGEFGGFPVLLCNHSAFWNRSPKRIKDEPTSGETHSADVQPPSLFEPLGTIAANRQGKWCQFPKSRSTLTTPE